MGTFTMIAVYAASKTGNDVKGVTGYSLISSDYQTVMLDATTLAKNISNKSMVVTNLGIKDGKIVSTNGALDRYNIISTQTNAIIGAPMAVILDRVERDGKLVGYTMFTQDGRIKETSVAEAVMLCNNKAISNGKIRHTDNGDIVSAIGGNYTLRQIEPLKAPTGQTTVDLMYFEEDSRGNKYFGAIISCTSAVEMGKISSTFGKSNAELVERLSKVRDNAKRDLGVQRVDTNSIFGAFPLDMLDKLTKLKTTDIKYRMMTDNILVSSYGTEKPSVVKLSKAFKIVGADKSAGEKQYEKTFAFAQEIIKRYSGVIKLG